MASEKSLQDAHVKALSELTGVRVVNIVASPRQETGISDLLLNWHGLFVAIELKEPGRFGGKIVFAADFVPKDRRETRQRRFQLEVLESSGIAFFSDNLAATLVYLNKILL